MKGYTRTPSLTVQPSLGDMRMSSPSFTSQSEWDVQKQRHERSACHWKLCKCIKKRENHLSGRMACRNPCPMFCGYLAVIWQNRISPKPLILQREDRWLYWLFWDCALDFKCYPLFPAPINPALFALALFRSFPCIEKSIRSLIFDFHHVPYEIFPKPGCWSPRYRMSETGNWKSSLEAMLESLYTKASCMIHLVWLHLKYYNTNWLKLL